ncbi:MAG: hypothetical protein SFU98_17920 [Leptospiraceae bacterium]|nr:hypothetical protein [Leptospiraceae bacterium]
MLNNSNIYSIPIQAAGKLAIISRPARDEFLRESIESLKKEKIDTVISALMQYEESELGLSKEKEICKELKMDFLSFPIEDRAVPESFSAMQTFSKSIKERILLGQSVGIHCRAEIGRSSILCSCILFELGFSVDQAILLISESRKLKVPDTEEQVDWLINYFQFR